MSRRDQKQFFSVKHRLYITRIAGDVNTVVNHTSVYLPQSLVYGEESGHFLL